MGTRYNPETKRNEYIQDPINASLDDAKAAQSFGYHSLQRGMDGRIASAVDPATGQRVNFVNGQPPEMVSRSTAAKSQAAPVSSTGGPLSSAAYALNKPTAAAVALSQPAGSSPSAASANPTSAPSTTAAAFRGFNRGPSPDVALSLDQSNRSAATTPSAGGGVTFTGFGPGASTAAPYASGGNFDTRQATNDFATGKITAAQRDQVYSAASQATNTQGAGISPSTQAEMRGTAGVGQQLQASQDAQQAADAAYQRQNPGPPSAAQGGYGLLPGGGGPTTVAPDDGGTLIYNGKVVAPGTSVTPVNFGKTVFGNPDGSAQVGNSQPGAPSAADADYKAQEQAALKAYPAIGVAGSPENRSFVQAFNTGGADKSNVLGLANSLFAPKDQTASTASPNSSSSTVAGATTAGASSGALTPGQDWFNSLLQRNQPASPLAPASTAVSSSTAGNSSGYPERPAPPAQPYTIEQQFKDLQAGGTGAPPTPPAYTPPKVYDKNDPSSLPDATTNAQMAFIRNIADPTTGNPVSPFDKSPAPPNSLLASTAPGAGTNLGGPATSTGAGAFDTTNPFANGRNPFTSQGTASTDPAGSTSSSPAFPKPATTAATTPAGSVSLDSTNPFAGGKNPFTLQSAAPGTNPAAPAPSVDPDELKRRAAAAGNVATNP